MTRSFFRPEIEALSGYVPGEQPRGGKFIKLNTNENPYRHSAAVDRAVEAVLRGGLMKYPDPLAEAFRVRAAALLSVAPDWVLCGNGSDDLLTILTRAFVGQRQWLRLPYPSYILYRTLAQIQGAEAEEIHFNPDWSLSDAFGLPADELRLVFLPNPNSPSGTVVPREGVRELAGRLPCPLVVDEAYVDFAEGSCVELVRECDNLIVSRSLSKSYALAGLRFGFLVAHPQVVRQLIKVKDSYNCDALSIAAATAAIDDQAWLAQTRARIVATRERLTAEMRGLGFAAVDSQANFVWCPHPARPVRPLYEGLKERGVLVRYMDYPGWGDGLRVSVGSDEQIDAMLELLQGMML
jgi:histidinol-phosphate aminotransferase